MAKVILSLWTQEPLPLPLVEYCVSVSVDKLPDAVIFISGLTDTMGVVPYLERLAQRIEPLGFSLVQPQLSSSLGGFGCSSLEGDAREIAEVIRYLRSREENRKDKIILMGHSTGCQDVVRYLSQGNWTTSDPTVKRSTARQIITGGILQAPVSDREDFEAHNQPGSQGYRRLEDALRHVREGNGSTLLPRKVDLVPTDNLTAASSSNDDARNSDAVLKAPMTATRFADLFSHGGADDFFSSDLSDEAIMKYLGAACQQAPILALPSQKDEYLPTSWRSACAAEKLLHRWSTLLPDTRFKGHVINNANHKVDSAEAQIELCDKIVEWIRGLKEVEERDVAST